MKVNGRVNYKTDASIEIKLHPLSIPNILGEKNLKYNDEVNPVPYLYCQTMNLCSNVSLANC